MKLLPPLKYDIFNLKYDEVLVVVNSLISKSYNYT